MTTSHDLTLDAASQVWDELAARVDALIAAWESPGDPPELAAHLPEEPGDLRQLLLVECIKVDLEYRWLHRALPKAVEDYAAEFPELVSGGQMPCDLIFEEFHIRQRAGHPLAVGDYLERFPAQAEEIRRLLGTDQASQSTMLYSGEPEQVAEVGQQLDDFELLARLGKGAFATVFLARQVSMQRLVALKVSSDRGDEPQTLAQLDHPNIVRVYDQRLLPEKQTRLLYMQLVPGGTLQEVNQRAVHVPLDQRNGQVLLAALDAALDRGGHSSPTESSLRRRLGGSSWGEMVCWMGARLAAALDYAHRRGVLHRDVKPANVLLDAEGAPKLADFNISFCSKVEGASASAFFGGSLAYMSPEQLEAYNPSDPREPDSIDGLSDVFSLGVLLWELLTGQRPWGDESIVTAWGQTLDKMTTRRRGGVEPALTWNPPPGCPPGLQEVLLKCLAPDPDDRWRSGVELAQQLELCLKPAARELLRGPNTGWRRRASRIPIACLIAMVVLPNAVGAIGNLLYNQDWINAKPGHARVFEWMVLLVNPLLFTVGIALLFFLAWPIRTGLRARESLDPQRLAALRRSALRLGHYVAVLGILEWLIAGMAFPLGLSIFVEPMTAREYAHFISSMTVCGLMSAAYPYFGVTFLATRVFVPALMRGDTVDKQDLSEFARASRVSYFYLLLAIAPTAGVILLLVFGSTAEAMPILILSAANIAVFAIIFWLYRMIQRDLDLLAQVTNPETAAGGSSDSTSNLSTVS
jgi:serine/threonine protein kinase